ncbi:LysR family transcriptional regulator [Mycolicibacterium litorale]|uniref:LysR family transcriptional regulator n=1 Tax=Mycolicibacterium litorale TaxID=758802 RepID=UPI003CEE1D37
MELRTLRYFTAVAEAGTVSAAAAALHVTQPGLSRQLRRLERELGVALFDRISGRLTLSAAGRALLPRARDVIAQAEHLGLDAKILATGQLNRLTVAAPATTLAEVVAPFIATLEPHDPVPSVFASDGFEPEEALRRGADLVIVNGRPGGALKSLALAVLPVWAYVPAGHEWAHSQAVHIEAVVRETVISLPETFTARQMLAAACLTSGLALHVGIEASSGAVTQALAAAGRGVAVVTDDPRFELHPLEIMVRGGALSIRLFAAWDPQHPGASTLASISNRLSEYIIDRYGDSVQPSS